jgi:hypothetical protein
MFKALSPNDDQNEQQTFLLLLFSINTCMMVLKKVKAKKNMGAKTM